MPAGFQARYNVGILLFDEVEVLDFAGPFEVFSVATRVSRRDRPGQPAPFNVFTLGDTDRTIAARHGLHVRPHHILGHEPDIDILIVPGGVVTAELSNENLMNWIRTRAAQAQIVASVCTGAFLLAESGVLTGHATTHWEDLDDLKSAYPQLQTTAGVMYTEEGNILTSAGISAGIEMSFRLIERMVDPELAEATARQMEYVRQTTVTGT